MSPLDKIRRGIAERSWKDVVDGFSQLTGEKLAVPQEERSTPKRDEELLENMLKLFSNYLGNRIEDSTMGTPLDQQEDEIEIYEEEQEDEEEEETAPSPSSKSGEREVISPKSGKKMEFFTTEPTEEDRRQAEGMAKLRGKDTGRSAYVMGKCENCGGDTDEVVRIMEETKYMCDTCLRKRSPGMSRD